MKRCLTSLFCRETLLKAIMKHHFIHSSMAEIKKKTITNVIEDVEKLGPSYIAGQNVEWCNHFGKQ